MSVSGHELKSGAKYLNQSDTNDLSSGAVIVDGGLAIRKKIRSGQTIIVEAGGVNITGNSVFFGDVNFTGNLTVTGNITVSGDTKLSFLDFESETIAMTANNTPPILGKAYIYCSANENYSLTLPVSPPTGRTCNFIKTDATDSKITLLAGAGDTIIGTAYIKNQHDHIVIVYNGITNSWHLV